MKESTRYNSIYWNAQIVQMEGPTPVGSLIGLSLSQCVKYMIKIGQPDLQNIAFIISDTAITSLASLKQVQTLYAKSSWTQSPQAARVISNWLWETGRILQPRLLPRLPQGLHNMEMWAQSMRAKGVYWVSPVEQRLGVSK